MQNDKFLLFLWRCLAWVHLPLPFAQKQKGQRRIRPMAAFGVCCAEDVMSQTGTCDSKRQCLVLCRAGCCSREDLVKSKILLSENVKRAKSYKNVAVGPIWENATDEILWEYVRG